MRRSRAATCTAAATVQAPAVPSNPASDSSRKAEEACRGGKRIVVIGGTGRIGSSTAAALLKYLPSCSLVVASRSAASFEAVKKRRPELGQIPFEEVDIDDMPRLESLLKGSALVIHAAGPFQRKEGARVLEAAIATGTPYMDVCDDTKFSQRMKTYHEKAKAAGVPAITTAGIYPGVSNIMAAHMVSCARKECDKAGRYMGQLNGKESSSTHATSTSSSRPEDWDSRVAAEPLRCLYSYYTAGSGGAGPTILETSFLLAGEGVEAYLDGEKVDALPVSKPRVVDFGKGCGKRRVYLYNLPEVHSTFKYMRVPTVSARFGTAPEFWNWAMVAVARLAPKGMLQDRSKIKAFGKLSDPWVRLIDPIIGEQVGMRVDVDLSDGTTACGLFVHKRLSDSVGICIAAFAQAVLAGETQPGVWFPEEPEAVQDRPALLKLASRGCTQFQINRPPWAIETDPKQLGMGFYW
ncbi:hypothetical protein WJX74_002531 [Apatococcus lobatus]|uniref:Saccharopine dehydrogenase NADP binding domain-containing protein n=1 Tax=Apatococcus lobatus TaxID=904363 RepID=A0AAW1RVK4_9CHLO